MSYMDTPLSPAEARVEALRAARRNGPPPPLLDPVRDQDDDDDHHRDRRGWFAPTPLTRRSEPSSFPIEVFPEWLREFVAAEAEATQTPIDMGAMFSLAALATITAGRVQVQPVPGWVEGVNLFIAVAMEPGSRKSAVHRDVTAPIREYEHLLTEGARPDLAEQASIRRIAEVALTRIEKAAANETDRIQRLALEDEARTAASALDRLEVPSAPRLFTADVTPESLASLLHSNQGRIAVLSAEGGIFDIMAGRYSAGSPNLDVYLQGHAGDPIRVDRRGRAPEFVDHPALTVGLAVQPYVLTKAARVADFGGRGLLDRFLYAIPSGTVGWRRTDTAPVPEELRVRYDTSIRALAASFDRFAEPKVLGLSPDGLALFRRWMAEIEPRRRPDADLGHIQGWASKLDGAIVRIAGLLHLADGLSTGWDHPISQDTIAGAIQIGRYLIEHALAAFDEMGGDPALVGARRVLRWVRQRSEFTKRECHRAHLSTFHEAGDLDPVLLLLEDHGYVREKPTQATGGRPSRRFEVNPYSSRQNRQNGQKGGA